MDYVDRAGTLGHQRAGNATANAISGDTFTGQLAHMDELINSARTLQERVAAHANHFAPAETTDSAKRTDALAPEGGPMLFRWQNKNSELSRLLSSISQQLSRIDQVL